jgi:hypothetical protein
VIREVSTVAAGLREDLFQPSAYHRRLGSFSRPVFAAQSNVPVSAGPEWYASNQKKTFD